jgi:sporulation protein YlmC with PRC-barrel domain
VNVMPDDNQDLSRYISGMPVNAVSVQDATDDGRALLGQALHWVGVRFVGYLLVMLASAVAFLIWGAVYTYVWPGKPTAIESPASPTIETPAPVKVPAPAPIPIGDSPAISQVPPDAFPIANLHKLGIYDANDAQIGQIQDVLFNPEGRIVFFIVGISSGFLGGQGKDIAVPVQAVQFKKKDQNTWMPVLNMSKDAVQNAPKQTFDPAAMKWKFVPVPAR